jgi:CBS domain-containing protein
MGSAGDLLRNKGKDIWTTTLEATVFDALQLMADKNVGALLVIESGRLVGIFSERDYARKVVLKGKFSKSTTVREVMTGNLVTATPNQSIEECMQLMTEHRIRHLPILEDGKLAGLISIRDVVEALISDKEFIITQLENYITGKS